MLGSQYAMPIIVLNMGGEMIYILNQRLQAQNIPIEKSRKVLGDVIRTMYTPMFLEELFKPQEVYTMASTKQIFDKLAHSSIMRLNKTSMDKLFDLMTMGVKYQLLACKSPHQYLQVTLNHLDTLQDMVKTEGVNDLIQEAVSNAIELYSTMSNGNWQLLEQTLMQFFQGKKIKVSLFLQRSLQTLTGSLVLTNSGNLPFSTEIPGQIRYFENQQVYFTDEFATELRNICKESADVLEPNWTIGCNIYVKDDPAVNAHSPGALGIASPTSKPSAGEEARNATSSSSSSSASEAARAFAAAHATGGGGGVSAGSPDVAPGKGFGNGLPSRPASKFSTQISAKAELTLLSDLLGISGGASSAKGGTSSAPADKDKLFRINLFPNEGFQAKDAEGGAKDSSGGGGGDLITIDIDAAAGAKSMSTYMEELDWDDELGNSGAMAAADAKGGAQEEDEDDLLALMDSAK
mmetsp:Transcript_25661/g.43035  ORF Transcript_25661/g.43035 Transcript_25661/m.43035 type:complete len:463 (-) Transcript_25661:102-1490(-)